MSSPAKDQALPSHMQADQSLCFPSHIVCMSLYLLINGWLPSDCIASAEALYLHTCLRFRPKTSWSPEEVRRIAQALVSGSTVGICVVGRHCWIPVPGKTITAGQVITRYVRGEPLYWLLVSRKPPGRQWQCGINYKEANVTDFMTRVTYFSQAAEKGHNLKPSETAYAAILCVWRKQSSRWHFLSLIYETHWKFRNRSMCLDKDNIVLGEKSIYLPKLNRIYLKDGARRSGCQCYSEQTHTGVQYAGMRKSFFWGSCKRSICSLADSSVACYSAVNFERPE